MEILELPSVFSPTMYQSHTLYCLITERGGQRSHAL